MQMLVQQLHNLLNHLLLQLAKIHRLLKINQLLDLVIQDNKIRLKPQVHITQRIILLLNYLLQTQQIVNQMLQVVDQMQVSQQLLKTQLIQETDSILVYDQTVEG